MIFDRGRKLLFQNSSAQGFFGKLGIGEGVEVWFDRAGFHDLLGNVIEFKQFPYPDGLSVTRMDHFVFLIRNERHPDGIELITAGEPLVIEEIGVSGAFFTFHQDRTFLQGRLDNRMNVGISHELRTPLTTILGYLDALLDTEQTGEERVRFLKIIRDNSRDLLTLMEDLLKRSGVEDKKDVRDSSVASRLPMSGLESRRILIMEDSDENRDIYEIFLKNAGAEVVGASDGAEGLKLAQASPFDLILIDIRMPKKNGFEVAQELRMTLNLSPRPRLVALTADVMVREHKKWQDAGFDVVLTKPITADALVKAIQEQINFSNDGAKQASQHTLTKGVEEIVGRFAEQARDQVQSMYTDWRNGKWDELGNLLHRFKGAATNCGFVELGELAISIEDEIYGARRPTILESRFATLISLTDSLTKVSRSKVALQN